MKIDPAIWIAIGAGIGYLIARLHGAWIGGVIGGVIYAAAYWWLTRYQDDPNFVGPREP